MGLNGSANPSEEEMAKDGRKLMEFMSEEEMGTKYAILVSFIGPDSESDDESNLVNIITNVPDSHRAALLVEILTSLRHNEPDVYEEILARLLDQSIAEFAALLDADSDEE